MAWTQTQLDNLEDAIAKGVLEIKYNDKVIKYRSLKEMITIRNETRKSLGQVKNPSRLLIETDKGIC